MNDYIIFGKPSIQKEEIDEVVNSLKSNWLGTGPKVKRFEKDFKSNIIKCPGPFLQCVLIKKQLITNIGVAFDSQAIPSEDWDFFITISKLNPIVVHCKYVSFIWNVSHISHSLYFFAATFSKVNVLPHQTKNVDI